MTTTRTVDWFNNHVRFIKVEAESTKDRRVARCEDEPRLTVVTTEAERTYHVDGKPSNNAIGNLREASNRENQQNQAKHRAGKLPGVTFNSVGLRRPYQARMLVDGRSRSLGMYATPEEAHAAYLKGCAALLDETRGFSG